MQPCDPAVLYIKMKNNMKSNSWMLCDRRNKALVKELDVPKPGSSDLYFPTQYSQSFFTQVRACFWKQWWTYWRSPPYNCARFMFTVISAFLFGTIFWNMGKQTYALKSSNNFMSTSFRFTFKNTFTGIICACTVFHMNLRLVC